MRYFCDYNTAIKWCHNSFILFNELNELDENIWENYPEDEEGNFIEVYQTFITDCSDFDVQFLQRRFKGLYFVWSDKFCKWFLLVDHYGTSWDYVPVEITKQTDENEQDFLVCLDIIKDHAKKYFYLEDEK